MRINFTERHNYTDEQVEQHVADALALVDRLSVPDDLRVAAFTEALRLGSGKQILAEQPQPVAAGMVFEGLGPLR